MLQNQVNATSKKNNSNPAKTSTSTTWYSIRRILSVDFEVRTQQRVIFRVSSEGPSWVRFTPGRSACRSKPHWCFSTPSADLKVAPPALPSLPPLPSPLLPHLLPFGLPPCFPFCVSSVFLCFSLLVLFFSFDLPPSLLSATFATHKKYQCEPLTVREL